MPYMNNRCPKIKCAAIQFEGKIYEGKSHCEIGLQMVRDKICEHYPAGDAQGFVDEEGNFRSRYQALRMAIHNGQVPPEMIKKDQLYSEYLRGYKDDNT